MFGILFELQYMLQTIKKYGTFEENFKTLTCNAKKDLHVEQHEFNIK